MEKNYAIPNQDAYYLLTINYDGFETGTFYYLFSEKPVMEKEIDSNFGKVDSMFVSVIIHRIVK